MNPNVVAAFHLLGRLYDRGVTHCVLSPGSRSTPLAYVACELFETTVVIDERDGGFLSLGIAESTDRPVVVITTSGSAPTHLYPSIVEAFHSSIPMIIISADRPHELRGIGSPQTIDQVNMFNRSVRYSSDAICPHDQSGASYWRDIADKLYFNSCVDADVAGPVHLNMGMREPLVPDGDEKYEISISQNNNDYEIDRFKQEIESPVVELINNSKNIMVTLGKNCQLLPHQITTLNQIGIVVLADIISNVRSDSTINMYDLIVRKKSIGLLPDLIIQFGEPVTSKYFNNIISNIPIISLHKYDDHRDPYNQIQFLIITSGSSEAVDQFIELLKERTNSPEFYLLWKQEENIARRHIDTYFSEANVSEPCIYHYLSSNLQQVEEELNIIFASSMPIRYAEWLWHPSRKHHYFSHRGTNGIDGMLSTAYGIAFATCLPTITVLGDVAFSHDIGFLSQCVLLTQQNNQTIVFIVIDNNGGAIFSHLDQYSNSALKNYYKKIFQTPPQIDIKAIASATGAIFHSGSIDDCISAIVENITMQSGQVHIVHIKVEHDSGFNTMDQLRQSIIEQC